MSKVLERCIEQGEAQYVHNRLHARRKNAKNILNKNRQSGAMLACIHNKPDVLQVYIDAEADLYLKDRQGYSAMAHAINSVDKWKIEAGGQWQCVDKLVKHCRREEVLQQAAAANLVKTVEYILRGTETWADYLSAIQAAADDILSQINAIKNLAIHSGHQEIVDLCVFAANIAIVAIDVQPEEMEVIMR